MEFRLLGPVELWVGDRHHRLGSAKERCLFACLALSPRRQISSDALVDRLWGPVPPAKAPTNLQAHVSRLRTTLRRIVGDEVKLAYAGDGYVLHVDEETVDLHRFRRLRAQARAMAASGDDADAVRSLREADGLWRGTPLARLDTDWATSQRVALEAERQAAVFERIRAELRMSRHEDLVGELFELAARSPMNEEAVGHLMTALYRCHRQAEALDVYVQAYQRKMEEVGSQPDPSLQDLHQRILRNDPDLMAPPAAARVAFRASPNLLPRDIPEFTGRTGEIRRLMDALDSRRTGTAVPIVTIHGMPGVGKSAFANHVAHLLVDSYPDAQLSLEMHGHTPTQEPLDPATALVTLLQTLDAPVPDPPPPTVEERAALWRAHLTGRRVLLLLDDAAGVEQVRLLLPAAPECLVIITSRQRLTELGGTIPIRLGVLPHRDAVRLLREIAGPDQTDDASGVAEVARLCGHLPLALRVAGSKLREHPTWTIAEYAERLALGPRRPGRTRLDDNEVATAFELSYQDLPPTEQRAFRYLGLHPGSSFSAPAAAALSDMRLADTERILDRLYDRHLVEEPARGRFQLHDLFRDYAHDLALRDDPEPEHRLAVGRLLDHYADIAGQASHVLFPHRRRVDNPGQRPAAPPFSARAQVEARQWLEAERGNLLVAMSYAAEHGWAEHAALLADLVAPFLETAGYWTDAATVHERAVTVWRGLGNRWGEAQALTDLGVIAARTGSYGDALRHAQQALTMRREVGDRWGEGEAHNNIGLAYWGLGRYRDALTHCREALAIRRGAGDRRGEADTLNNAAMAHSRLGRYGRALDHFQAARAIYLDLDDLPGQLKTLNNIGEVQLHLGQHAGALDDYQRALTLVRRLKIPQNEATIVNNIGNIYVSMEDYDTALRHYRQALDICREIGDRPGEGEALDNIGCAYQKMGRHREALIHHQKALSIGQYITDPSLQARAHRNIGAAERGRNRFGPALNHYGAALDLARRVGDPYEEAHLLELIGHALLHSRGPEDAAAYWRQALAVFERLEAREADELRARLRTLQATGT